MKEEMTVIKFAKKTASLLAVPLLIIGLGLAFVAVGMAESSTPEKTTYHWMIGSCSAHKDGYTLTYQARIPLVNHGDGTLYVEKWRTRFSFTHQGGGDPLHLAARTGNVDTFYSDDSWTQFQTFSPGGSVPYNAWVKHDGTDQYAQIHPESDSPYIELSFDMPGSDPYCTVQLHVPGA